MNIFCKFFHQNIYFPFEKILHLFSFLKKTHLFWSWTGAGGWPPPHRLRTASVTSRFVLRLPLVFTFVLAKILSKFYIRPGITISQIIISDFSLITADFNNPYRSKMSRLVHQYILITIMIYVNIVVANITTET